MIAIDKIQVRSRLSDMSIVLDPKLNASIATPLVDRLVSYRSR